MIEILLHRRRIWSGSRDVVGFPLQLARSEQQRKEEFTFITEPAYPVTHRSPGSAPYKAAKWIRGNPENPDTIGCSFGCEVSGKQAKQNFVSMSVSKTSKLLQFINYRKPDIIFLSARDPRLRPERMDMN